METKTQKQCSVAGCPKKHFGKGFCQMHYQRWRKDGTPGEADERYESHGHTAGPAGSKRRASPEHTAYRGMIKRCYDPKHPSYKYYGERGIKVAQVYLDSFVAFLKEVGNRPGPGYSLERKNSNKDYEPGNIRWATRKEQDRNRRDNKNITIDNVTRCLNDWAKISGIDATTIDYRLKQGQDERSAVFDPPKNRGNRRPSA